MDKRSSSARVSQRSDREDCSAGSCASGEDPHGGGFGVWGLGGLGGVPCVLEAGLGLVEPWAIHKCVPERCVGWVADFASVVVVNEWVDESNEVWLFSL